MKRQESRAVIAWRGAANAGLVLSADRAYMKAPVPRPTPDFGTKWYAPNKADRKITLGVNTGWANEKKLL
ncbi:hypothetical protein, partial [Flavonifractor plautii]|uniref:hypothetical protein n=1 Tax=Flavonifractor plautii TaxID=292800 RepID=UPI003D7C6AA3